MADLPRVLWLVGYQITALPAASPRVAFAHLPRLRAEGAREAAAREAVLGMLRGSLVWRRPHPVTTFRVPFRLVGYWDRCPRCAGKCVHLPIASVMRSEAVPAAAPESCGLSELPRADAAAALKRYADRTGAAVARLSLETGAMLCPASGCGEPLPPPDSHFALGSLMARADIRWRDRYPDHATARSCSAANRGLGPPDPPAPVPWNGDPEADEDAWRDAVRHARRVNEVAAPSRTGTSVPADDLRDLALQFAEARLRFFRQDVLATTAGDEASANAWLVAPNPQLGGATPADWVRRSAAGLDEAKAAMKADLGEKQV